MSLTLIAIKSSPSCQQ